MNRDAEQVVTTHFREMLTQESRQIILYANNTVTVDIFEANVFL